MNTRRDLLRMAAVPVAWHAFHAKLQAAAASRLPDAGNESYWQMVKRQYPLADNLIYLNAANVCPASRLVLDRHLEYLRDFHSDPSFQNRDKYVPMRESLRAKVARMLRVSADEIAITRNTSEGSNIIVKGVDLTPGDEVLITDHNHPSNNDSWRVRARRDGPFFERALVGAEPHRPAFEVEVTLLGHEVDHRVRAGFVDLGRHRVV